MKAACCDWAIVHLGRPGRTATRARTCPKHLRGRTVHRYPGGRKVRPIQARLAQDRRIRETWARWAAAIQEAIQ